MTTFLFLNLDWMVALSFAGFRKAIELIQISILQNCWRIIIHRTRFWQILFYNWLYQWQVWIKCLSNRINSDHFSLVVNFVSLIDPSVCGIYYLMCMQVTVNDNSIIPDIQHWLTATAVLVVCVAIHRCCDHNPLWPGYDLWACQDRKGSLYCLAFIQSVPRIILYIDSTDERRRYIVRSPLIGCAETHGDLLSASILPGTDSFHNAWRAIQISFRWARFRCFVHPDESEVCFS